MRFVAADFDREVLRAGLRAGLERFATIFFFAAGFFMAFLAAVLRIAGFLAAVFLGAAFFFAAVFLMVFLAAVLRIAVFLAAVFLGAAFFFAVARLMDLLDVAVGTVLLPGCSFLRR